jgi:hypothetical protein
MENYKTTANFNAHKEEKPTGSTEKSVLNWKPHGGSKARTSQKDLAEKGEEDVMETGTTWSWLNELLVTGTGGNISQMPYAPEGKA